MQSEVMLLHVVLSAVAVSLLLGVAAAEGGDGGPAGEEKAPTTIAGSEYNDVVVKLNDDTFADAVKAAELMMVMFYAEW